MSTKLRLEPVNYSDPFNERIKWSHEIQEPSPIYYEVVANGGGYVGGRSMLLIVVEVSTKSDS